MSGFKEHLSEETAKTALREGQSDLDAIARLLKRSGIDPDDIDGVQSVRLSDYQQAYKDSDGEAHVLDLKATSLVLSPAWETGPKWPLIDKPVVPKVTFTGSVKRIAGPEDGRLRVVILPDPQFGFLKDVHGELHPFHDPEATAASITFLRAAKPDKVVILGDTVDLPVMSKYKTHPSYEGLMNPTLRACTEWLAAVRKAVGDECEIHMLEGNHDLRMQDYIMMNAKEAFGVKRALDPPDSWPVLSIPNLLCLEELGVKYVPGYPICRVELAPNLVAIHGKKLKLKQVITDEKVCAVQGHTHHAGVEYYQYRSDKATRQQRWVASPGCLCRTDGAVPGVNHAIDPRSHQPIDHPQDWQQGLGIIEYHEDGSTTPIYEHAPIEGGVLRWRGREFTGSL